MDTVRIDAVSERCVRCAQRLADRHRILPTYQAGTLVNAKQLFELGMFIGDVRPLWRHVDCSDPALERYSLLPKLDYCIRCRGPLTGADFVTPAFQVVNPKATNPEDPTDVGMAIGERIHFAHVDCGDRQLKASPLLVLG